MPSLPAQQESKLISEQRRAEMLVSRANSADSQTFERRLGASLIRNDKDAVLKQVLLHLTCI